MSKRRESNNFNVWRSYSDMMAGLLMLFVLIMCVTLFQAQKNYDEKIAEQEERMAMQAQYTNELDQQKLTVEQQEALLKSQDELLASQKTKLEEQAAKLAEQQATLKTQEEKLTQQQTSLKEQQTTLAEQEKKLAEQQATLKTQEGQITEQKAALKEQKGKLAEQQSALEEQTAKVKEKQAQLDKIIGVKADVIEALRNEFTNHNINVDIDPQTGALLLDSNVLFEFDDTTLLKEGEEVLQQVLPIYCEVLLGEEYRDNVAEIIIDGYTDTNGTYDYNLELSQKRSLAVAQYLLGIDEQFLDEQQMQMLQEKLTVNGHSMSNPILNEDGTVNMEASRRVEVKFRLKDEDMISEMSKIVAEE
ncbi:MAG: OmpA family protein [Eubacteriales bacterium]|nr:OmpA family protein [Eubacteriales bacterium]